MAQSPIPLTTLSEDQRAQAHTRFTIIRPALEDGVTQAQVARTHNIPAPTVQRWVKRYREKGLVGLADAKTRSDKGKSRRLPPDVITLVEGLALQTPRGRGKVERFFRSVNELLLQDLPGYAPEGSTGVEAKLTLPAFEQRFRSWLLSDYHHRVHSEIKCTPAERWERGGFVPRMPSSLEQLDLLLLTVRKARRVQQDGIRFEGYRYIDATLAGYVKEDVLIRYDPADLAEIRVYHQDTFVCRAICQELAGQTVSLKDIEKARSAISVSRNRSKTRRYR